MVDELSESAVIKLVIEPWAYEGEIKVRIDPVHQTELLERCAIGISGRALVLTRSI
jgi:hypothetical protein